MIRLRDILLMEQGGIAKNLYKIQFAEIPGTTNYRSGQPTLQQLEYIIKEYDIKNIIRLNGNEGNDPTSRAGGTVYTEQERDLAEKLGVTFYPESGEFVNAHDPWGGKEGKGYVNSIARVKQILDKGNTLIHCRNGADRTGYLVAKYLQDTQGWNDEQELWNYTVKYNHWCEMGKFIGSGYDKYAQGFIEDLDHEKFKQLCKNSYDSADTNTNYRDKTNKKEGLSFGDRGSKVIDMQQRLIYVLDDPLAVGPPQDDGIFGPYTEKGLITFQKNQGFNPSGIYDEESETKLKELTADVTDTELNNIESNNFDIDGFNLSDSVLEQTFNLIKYFEGGGGFLSTAMWDSNNWRIGYGSSTITEPDGTVIKLSDDRTVKPDYKISEEDAVRDLNRRLKTEFIPKVMKWVNEETPAGVIAALTSVAYNYGSFRYLTNLQDALRQAKQSGDYTIVADAVRALKIHNDGINANRRNKEADYILSAIENDTSYA